MIISPFILGALDIPVFFNFFSLFNNTQIKKSIMVIGMGSGILDMYFHKRFQNVSYIYQINLKKILVTYNCI